MGYGRITGKSIQSQPFSVAAAANSRFQITGSNGSATVVATRDASEEEKASRRRSARSSAGRMSEPREAGDYTLLPSSLRDLYLTGSHGLTSLYPAIMLTTPGSSGIVDVSTGTTTTPFVIDLNNEVKKTIETNVRDLINDYGPQIGLTSDEYEQNVQTAKNYADSCFSAATTKDNLISLFNVANINTQTTNLNAITDAIIGGREYEFLNGKESVIEFLKTIGDFKEQDFVQGSNTRNLAQVLKVLYDLFIFNEAGFGTTNSDPTAIKGAITYKNNSSIRNLQPLLPSALGEVDASGVNIDLFKDFDNLTSTLCVLQRDLIAQSIKRQIIDRFDFETATCQEALGLIIGQYKDSTNRDSRPSRILDTGFDDVDDIINYTGSKNFDVISLLVGTTETGQENFGKLDTGAGTDYLIYKDINRQTGQINLQQLNSFSQAYLTFSSKLIRFYLLMYKNDEDRKTVARLIRDMLSSFIRGSSIDTGDFSSTASLVRTGVLMIASKNRTIADELFNLMCIQDKINNNESISSADEESRKIKLNRSASRVFYLVENNLDLKQDGLFRYASGAETDTEERVIDGSYFLGSNISFQTFHDHARAFEEKFARGSLTSNQSGSQTDYSLRMSRDARAYVFYRMFLEVLKLLEFRVNTNSRGSPEIRIRYRNSQIYALEQALKFYDAEDIDAFRASVENQMRSEGYTIGVDQIVADASLCYNKIFAPLRLKANQQEQQCINLVNIVAAHAYQISQMKNLLQSSINEMQSTLSTANISGKESILNGMQLEQVLLKKNIIDRYANRLRSANYLPSAIDHNTNQAINTKTVVKTSSLFADNTDKSLTSRYLIVVGLPSGLLETLRYKSSSLQTGHLYTVRLYFKNIQLTGRTEEQIVESGGTLYASKPYTFSSRLFVSEGAQLFNGADITAPELTSYEQVAKATKFKVFDDQGNYVDITRNQVAGILSSEVATNHLNSHYGKLLLKTTSGISVEEEIFDLVPQVRTYPDAGKIPLYSTLVDLASNKFGVTAEDQLNKERTMRDLARSIQLAPTQHKASMMVSKTFERIHVIPIDINDIISDPAIQLSRSDISFINIIAEVEYSQFQPAINPVQSSTRTQSFANSLGERGDGLVTSIDIGTFNLQDQSVASVGINKIIETSNNAGGRFGGFRR